MADVALYSLLGFATAFSPNLIAFLIIRALFGIAMGGEWGIGASLTMESIKPEARGLVSGLLQSGYPTGYLLASIVYRNFYEPLGALTGMAPWRSLFLVGVVPALLILYIRRQVPESPGWSTRRYATHRHVFDVLTKSLAAGALCDPADDGVQLLQPRHAGRVSDVPAGATPFRRAHHRQHRDRLQHRRHPRRTGRSVCAARASAGDAPS